VPSEPTPLPVGPAARAQARARAQAQARARAAAERPAAAASPASAPAAPAPATPPLRQVAVARARGRHWWLLASFLLVVVAPAAAWTTYLYTRAAPQYHSVTAFSVRSEQLGSAAAAGILGAITQLGSGTASDINVLFDYIRSQAIVETIDKELDLRAMFNRHSDDVWFSLGKDPSIEHLVDYWRRMVTVDLSNAGIIEVRVNAFTPGDAHAIAQAIIEESSRVVNELSEQAHEDAVRYSREELDQTEARLRDVRRQLATFRREHRIIDPSVDVSSQAGILNALQSELARAMVERDMILSYADAKDQRVVQADRRIDAISKRIEAERDGMESGGVKDALPEVVGDYEALRTDLEIASTAYTRTLAGYAAAEAEARRQSRYLAPHIQPTLAEESLYPKRPMLAGMATLFLFLGWGILVLIYYNVRDNSR
jgi:capsular polysaccharide transport system permease protein